MSSPPSRDKVMEHIVMVIHEGGWDVTLIRDRALPRPQALGLELLPGNAKCEAITVFVEDDAMTSVWFRGLTYLADPGWEQFEPARQLGGALDSLAIVLRGLLNGDVLIRSWRRHGRTIGRRAYLMDRVPPVCIASEGRHPRLLPADTDDERIPACPRRHAQGCDA